MTREVALPLIKLILISAIWHSLYSNKAVSIVVMFKSFKTLVIVFYHI